MIGLYFLAVTPSLRPSVSTGANEALFSPLYTGDRSSAMSVKTPWEADGFDSESNANDRAGRMQTE